MATASSSFWFVKVIGDVGDVAGREVPEIIAI